MPSEGTINPKWTEWRGGRRAPTGGFLESVFVLRYEISGSKGKGQKEKSGLSNGDERYRIAPL